jgi:hypothetical protein
MIPFFMISFLNETGASFFLISLIILGVNTQKYEDGLIQEPLDFLNLKLFAFKMGGFLFVKYVIWIIMNQIRGRLTTIKRFKKIMSQSEDGIAIIKDKITIQFVNDKFLQQH